MGYPDGVQVDPLRLRQVSAEVGQALAMVGRAHTARGGDLAVPVLAGDGWASVAAARAAVDAWAVFVGRRHAEILDELYQQWTAAGYELETNRRIPAEASNELAIRTPDGFRVRLIDTEPPTALSLLIGSPCRRSPTPLF